MGDLSADENGHFVIERVPEGLVTIAFPYQAAPDYGTAFQWSAQVVAGAIHRDPAPSTLRSTVP